MKKVLDMSKSMRYTKWVAEMSGGAKASGGSLKTKQCNMNHLWFKPDVFKTSIDYEHKQSAISLLSFIFEV